jgi:hypothetical protein
MLAQKYDKESGKALIPCESYKRCRGTVPICLVPRATMSIRDLWPSPAQRQCINYPTRILLISVGREWRYIGHLSADRPPTAVRLPTTNH